MANIYKNAKIDLISTDDTVLYTVPSNSRAIVKSILVTEDANSGTTITVSLLNSAGAVFNIAKTKPIAALATIQILTEPLIMQESEVLKVQAGDANELFVISSILEINREDR
jgi:hypothetical protein|tara:strand:+ start:517 stop:852 length:336 start_codon:yes stop_codon:yes gene_type:complete